MIKKYLSLHPVLFSTIVLLFPLHLIAQNQLLSSSRSTIVAQIDIADGQLEMEQAAQIQGVLIQSLSPQLQNDDITFSFQLQEGKEEEEYRINIRAMLDGAVINIKQEDLLGDYQDRIPASGSQGKEIIWSGLLDRYYDFRGRLEVILSVELWGQPTLPFGVRCDEVPVFDGRQKLPYYIAAGAGLAALGISFVIGSEAQKIYDDDYLSQNFEQAAEPFYQDANDKRHTALLLRYGGIAVLVADAAVYFYRRDRHKKKLATFSEFCGNAPVSVRPVYERTSEALAGSSIGLKFAYRF
ncbi:MAG: hypothetical protein HKN76_20735 [Saprospiraceae bacterium]|nr:hypothetical protein [Saprospiraceae bacterium]